MDFWFCLLKYIKYVNGNDPVGRKNDFWKREGIIAEMVLSKLQVRDK